MRSPRARAHHAPCATPSSNAAHKLRRVDFQSGGANIHPAGLSTTITSRSSNNTGTRTDTPRKRKGNTGSTDIPPPYLYSPP
jgi:hypothetical protein